MKAYTCDHRAMEGLQDRQCKRVWGKDERDRALRTLLYLFRRDEAVQYLRGG